MAGIHEQAKKDYLGGMKYKDIAAKYNVSIDTVKSWKTRHKWERKGVHTKKQKVCKQKKVGGQPNNTNAVTHGLRANILNLIIPEEDKELYDACAAIGNLEHELQIARYKVNRLIREQQKREMQGVMGGPYGVENFRLKDDFYEQAIQKGLDIVRKIEAQLQKERLDMERLKLDKAKLLLEIEKAKGENKFNQHVDALKQKMAERKMKSGGS